MRAIILALTLASSQHHELATSRVSAVPDCRPEQVLTYDSHDGWNCEPQDLLDYETAPINPDRPETWQI